MTRSSMALGRATAGEIDITWDMPYYPGRSTKAVIFCHGSGENATTTAEKIETRTLMESVAKKYRVLAADFGGQTWGNDTAIAKIHEAITWLQNNGSPGPVVLMTGSMGNANGMSYALAHPENVCGIAGIIPLISLASIASLGYTAVLNVAYPPAYNDATHGLTHSPIKFATQLRADMPIKLFTASNDPLTLPQFKDEFIALRPQTEHFDAGAVGHSGVALTNSNASIVEFVNRVHG